MLVFESVLVSRVLPYTKKSGIALETIPTQEREVHHLDSTTGKNEISGICNPESAMFERGILFENTNKKTRFHALKEGIIHRHV